MAEKEDLQTVWIKKKDVQILEDLKDHPRQAIHEIISEVVEIATKSRRFSK